MPFNNNSFSFKAFVAYHVSEVNLLYCILDKEL
jgi:hypothetical protein